MKKSLFSKMKAVIFVLLMGAIFISNNLIANAASQTITITAARSIPEYIPGIRVTEKLTTTGEDTYCLDRPKGITQNVTATLVGERDAGLAYILENGYPSKSITGDNNKDYYITQLATWWYLDETTGSTNLSQADKTTSSDPYNLRPTIKNLVVKAKEAKTKGYATTAISLSVSNDGMTLSNDSNYFESSYITVNSTNITNYTVVINKAPVGTIIVDAGGTAKNTYAANEKFKVKVPAAKVTDTTMEIKISVNATGTVNKAYEYQPSNKNLQNVGLLAPETKEVSASTTLSIESSKVTITKYDSKTGNPLAGAHLVLIDPTGKEISWVSTTEAHIIRNLPNGTYTVKEVKAPNGYKLSDKPTTFTISNSNRNIQVKIYNDPKTSVVNIQKIDGSTGKPLAGAILVVRTGTGELVIRFETTTEPKVLTDLADGTYTVEEESAPNGYKKSNNKITFTIDDTHQSYQIPFENYPEVPVPNTSSNSSIIMMIFGIILISSAIGFVRKNVQKAR